jgi:hydroxymethylpyrimidine pyrophosphatase-like HAD family hydrolase
VHPRTRAAVLAVRGAAIPFVIVTGRMFRSVKRYLDLLELDGLVVCY